MLAMADNSNSNLVLVVKQSAWQSLTPAKKQAARGVFLSCTKAEKAIRVQWGWYKGDTSNLFMVACFAKGAWVLRQKADWTPAKRQAFLSAVDNTPGINLDWVLAGTVKAELAAAGILPLPE